jgi:hypothetical protein
MQRVKAAQAEAAPIPRRAHFQNDDESQEELVENRMCQRLPKSQNLKLTIICACNLTSCGSPHVRSKVKTVQKDD